MTSLSLIPMEHNNQRILTTAQLAQFYGTDAKHINDNFQNNKDRYIEGKHFYRLDGEALQQLKALQPENFGDPSTKYISILYLWTEKGALQHAKSLSTDEAWEKYEALVDNYYRRGDEIAELRQRLKHLEQQSAPLPLPEPIFKTIKEAWSAEPHCTCPTQEEMEFAILSTIQLLQPHHSHGISGSSLVRYNEHIQSYITIYGAHGLLSITESLVERNLLIREEINGVPYYAVPVIAGQLQ